VFLLIIALLLQVPPDGAEEGIVTFYGGEKFEGNVLRCGGRYEPGTGPWVAVDAYWLKSGRVHCGEWVVIGLSDGSVCSARVMDTGYLAEYDVVADLPYYWRDGVPTGWGWILIPGELERRPI